MTSTPDLSTPQLTARLPYHYIVYMVTTSQTAQIELFSEFLSSAGATQASYLLIIVATK